MKLSVKNLRLTVSYPAKGFSCRGSWFCQLAQKLLIAATLSIICPFGIAGVNFVQLTDPHLFGGEPENEKAFSNCIHEINIRLDRGADYSFVVLTGDIGIEDLVSTKVGDLRELKKNVEIERNNGAAIFAKMIGACRVKTWLMVPGN